MPDQFEKMDASLRYDLKLAKPTVPAPLLNDFSASVVEKIRERELHKEAKLFAGMTWIAPAFAVLVLASALVWRLPIWTIELPLTSQQMAAGTVQVIGLTANVASIVDEVAALRELGVWTEEDDASAGTADEI